MVTERPVAKKVTKVKVDKAQKVVKAPRAAAKTIVKPLTEKPKPKTASAKAKPGIKSLALKVRVQTAEGWKRGMVNSRQKKGVK